MRLTVVGSGDAFGSGGRFNTCFHVAGETGSFLIDCGASSLIALRRSGVDPNAIGAIFLSHLHGDHFGGLPFFLLDAQVMSRRRAPLTIAGPEGLPARLRELQEALFPRSSETRPKFELNLVELPAGERREVAGVAVTPVAMDHFSGTPSNALRLESEGRILAYSGDTAWTEALIAAARGADLFICEASFRGRKVSGHMDVDDLLAHLAEIGAKRTVLTHMGDEMLAQSAPEGTVKAHDDLEIAF